MSPLKKPEWFFYPAWIAGLTLVGPLAFALSLAMVTVVADFVGDFIVVNGVEHITEDYLFMYFFVAGHGLITGIVQYGLLRRYLPRMGWWVAASVAGWLFAFGLIVTWEMALTRLGSAELTATAWAKSVIFALLGLGIGVAQWLLLRRRLPAAGWWIVASTAGWGLARLLTGDSLTNSGELLALGIVPASLTAVTLALLIFQATPPEPQAA